MSELQTINKTIIYMGGFELPDKNAAAQRVVSNAKLLEKRGYRVILIGISHSNNYSPILQTKKQYYGFDCYSLKYPVTKKEWMKYLTSIKEVREVIETQPHVDALICYNYPAISLAKLRSYCKCNNINIWCDCTEWYNTNNTGLVFKILKGFDSWLRMTQEQKRVDGLIVISSYLEDYYGKYTQVIKIPPLVDIEDEKWTVQPKQFESNTINFVYTGSPWRGKDRIDDIVNVFKQIELEGLINNLHLWVMGVTEEQFKTAYPEILLENTGNVHFLGWVSHKESLGYVRGADCSLIIRESTRTNNAGFPTKFVEAVTLETNILATEISDLKEYESELPNVTIFSGNLKEAIISATVRAKQKTKDSKIMELNPFFDYRNFLYKIENRMI